MNTFTDQYLKKINQKFGIKHDKNYENVNWKNKYKGHLASIISNSKNLTILDYGCGDGNLLKQIKNTFPYQIKEIFNYDPGSKIFNKKPDKNKKFDIVICIDVLEHIEPEFLDNVLMELNNFGQKYIYLNIDRLPAKKKLSDGRNAHLIQEGPLFWKEKILKYFRGNIKEFFYTDPEIEIKKRIVKHEQLRLKNGKRKKLINFLNIFLRALFKKQLDKNFKIRGRYENIGFFNKTRIKVLIENNGSGGGI